MSDLVQSFDYGEDIILDFEFQDEASTYIDPPGGVRFSMRNPAGTQTHYTYGTNAELIKRATGKYRVIVDGNKAGSWFWRGYSPSGTGKGAKERQFIVRRSQFD